MRLIEEIIELAVGEDASIAVLLRKCLVLAHRLKNERLKFWVEKELNGYGKSDALPDYRIARNVISKGTFFGSFGTKLDNWPLPSALLQEKHRDYVEKAELHAPIRAYEPPAENGDGQWIIPWSPNLVAIYQKTFFKDDYRLAHAWQELPGPLMASVRDTVRNRILKFALEIQDELGSAGDDIRNLPAGQVDQTVINIIYGGIFGGSNVIAGRVNDVSQVGSAVVIEGDFSSLESALHHFGVGKEEVQELEQALAEDSGAAGSLTLGHQTINWIKSAAAKLASKSAHIGLDIAKAEMVAELTKLVSRFLGLT